MKNLTVKTLLAMTTIAMTGCTSEDFVGSTATPETQAKGEAISFSRTVTGTTRGNQNLENEVGVFKLYATKGSDFKTSFNNYSVWHQNEVTTVHTSSNPKFWEYVGKGTQTFTLGDNTTGTFSLEAEQFLKYWDYTVPSYKFYAIAPSSPYSYSDITYYAGGTTPTATNLTDNALYSGELKKAHLANVGGHLTYNSGTPASFKTYYLTNPQTVEMADYNKVVNLVFKRSVAKVRVGVYETIPGYNIKEIKFYRTVISTNGSIRKVAGSGQDYVILNRQNRGFVGGKGEGIVNYNNTDNTYGFAYTLDTKLKDAYQWHGGHLPNTSAGYLATTSNDPNLWGDGDADMASDGFFVVLPTPEAISSQPITICCDYILESMDATKEDITVIGARATIPAQYTTWKNNHAYTYLFKITENTNGTTGGVDPGDPGDPDHNDPSDPLDPSEDPTDPGTPDNPNPDYPDNPNDTPVVPDPYNPDPSDPDQPTPEGLYPITFDAVVEDYDDNLEGTTTTVSTPSITTYQNGKDVEANGLKYKTGENIVIRVMKGTTPCDLLGHLNVYKLSGNYAYNKTAEQNITQAGTEISIVRNSDQEYYFNSSAEATFVIKYSDSNSTAYKVVAVGKNNE